MGKNIYFMEKKMGKMKFEKHFYEALTYRIWLPSLMIIYVKIIESH